MNTTREDELQSRALLRSVFTPKRPPLSVDEARLLAGGRLSGVTVDGHELPLWSWGTGPRVLLVHGWDSRGVHLGRYVEALLRRGRSVTLYDATGHGEAPPAMSSVVHMGRALRGVARALGEVEAVIAHSAGSAAALWAFRDGLAVRRSVHLAGVSTIESLLRIAARMAGLDEARYAAFRAAAQAFLGSDIDDLHVERLAAGLVHPGLVVHDLEDPVVPPSESQALHAHWPGSVLRPVRGLGHRRLLMDAQLVEDGASFVCAPDAC